MKYCTGLSEKIKCKNQTKRLYLALNQAINKLQMTEWASKWVRIVV